MLRLVGSTIATTLLLLAGAAQAQVVISQVYAGSTPFSPVYRNGFIELRNTGNTAVNLSGWSVQYADWNSTTWSVTPLSGSIAPRGFYLVGQFTGPADSSLPATDAFGSVSMTTGAGKVALLNNQIRLTSACATSPSSSVVDLVGWGSPFVYCAESTAVPGLNDSTSATRTSNGCTDTNNNSADFVIGTPAPRNSLTTPLSCTAGQIPVLTISDAAAPEGNGPGSSVSTQIIARLNIPAPPGGVRFTASTSDGTAMAGSPGNPGADYVAQNWSMVIAEDETSATLVLPILGDTTIESDETLSITIRDLQGATLGDDVGVYTILNDDAINATIPEIQGPGLTSPLAGQLVSVEGIVTAHRASDGFFLQSANDDGNPATSEGIFVSTGGAPPVTAAVGSLVRVIGKVSEFTPSNDTSQLSVTRLASPIIEVLVSGIAVPAPIVLTDNDFNSASTPDSAERFEGMRVSAPRVRVVEGSGATIDEINAGSTNNGEFYAVLPGVARPFREPGISVLDALPIPADKNPPRFDGNPERLMVRSRGQIGANAIAVDVDAEVAGLVGVLDYFSGTWALLPDPSASIVPTGGKQPRAVADARSDTVTLGSFNLQRLSDEIDNGNGAPILSPAALDMRLAKASAAICDYLKAPDIVGVQDVENLRVLSMLADRINTTCSRAPAYRPYVAPLFPFPNTGTRDRNVGFLVTGRSFFGPFFGNRVDVYEIAQEGEFGMFPDPDFFRQSPINEHPPLRLTATVNHASGRIYPVTIFVNQFTSLDGIDSTAPGPNGWAFLGERVRTRRANQANYLANIVRQRQAANPNERIVLLGDFNAFDFNDGYADVMGILRGATTPQDQVLSYMPSPLLVPMVRGSEFILDPTERYSSISKGNAQALDHVLVSESVVTNASDIKVDYARINADFGAHHYSDAGSPIRVSERDPIRIAIAVSEFRTADLSVAISNTSPEQPRVGQPFAFTAVVTNNGPSDAEFPGISLLVVGPRPTSVNFTVAAPDGWNCSRSSSYVDITALCSTTSLAAGASASFTMSFVMTPEMANQTMQLAAAARTQTLDMVSDNNVFTTPPISVIAKADLSVQWAGGNELPLYSGARRDFLLSMKHLGPDPITRALVTFTVDAPTGTVEFYANNWFCASDYTSATVRTVCNYSYFFGLGPIEPGSETSFVVRVLAAPLADADGLNLSATVSGPASDTNPSNDRADLSMPLALANANLSVQWTKVPTAPLRSGFISEFALTLHNAGPDPAQRSSLIITADAPLNYVAIEPRAEGWFCTSDYSDVSPFVFECVNVDGPLAVGSTTTFNVQVRAPLPDANGFNISARVSATGIDANPSNNVAARSLSVTRATSDLSVKWSKGPKPPLRAGTVDSFELEVKNAGPDATWQPKVAIAIDAPFENVAFDTPAYWYCEDDYSGTTFKINCIWSVPLASRATDAFIFHVTAPGGDQDRLNLTANIGSAYISDPNSNNDQDAKSVNIVGK